MRVLQHKFCFSGHLCQSLHPDLFLTTMDGGGEVVPAHRVVMAAVSDKLATLCREGGRVVVRNINFQLLKKVVQFVYSGNIEMDNIEDVEDLRDGMDMLKVKIVIESDDGDKMQKSKDNHKRGDYMDPNENLVVENSFLLSTESVESKDLWSQSQNLIKIDNSFFVQRNQDTPVTASDTTNDGSDEGVAMSFPKILDSFTDIKTYDDKVVPKLSLIKKAPMSPNSKKEIQNSEITCDYCGDMVMYRKYRKHCMDQHTDSPWDTKITCGTCRNSIPAVNYRFHLELFGHEEQENIETGIIDNETKKTPKAQTKISCDYCEEKVAYSSYVDHCKKLHSISDDERCRRKCYKCGAKVHIIAEKFHQEIYHPAKPKHTPGKAEPLKIVEYNKTLTKIPCDFCSDTVVFGSYKGHVKTKHPEVAYAEMVKCGKCGNKMPKISFKFHRQIFHKSSKLQPQPISTNPPSLKLKFPQAKVPCTICSVRVKPHNMFWHVKNVHGKEAEAGHSSAGAGHSQAPDVMYYQAEVEHCQFEMSEISSIKDLSQDAIMKAALGANSDEDVAGRAEVDLKHRGEGEMENAGFRISTEQLSSDSSF